MRGETPLEYAEFQLSPRRTRCELFISSAVDGSRERVASGSTKPFEMHLRPVAEARTAAREGRVVLLPPGSDTTTPTWFTKGTLERLVRFVSKPEVIERVKAIEDELLQLEQVRDTVAIANTFSHSRNESVETEEARPDASKRELMRAMEARLNALHEEQIMAFARANAAGFDDRSVVNLMSFAENFGSQRLNDACTKFLALLRKRTVQQEESPTIESSSKIRHMNSQESEFIASDEEDWFPGSKRRLDFGVKRVEANHPEVGAIQSSLLPQKISGDSRQKQSFAFDPAERAPTGSTFLTHLHKMAQKIEARNTEDFGWHNKPEVDEKGQTHTHTDENISYSSFIERSSSLPTLRAVNVQNPLVSHNAPIDAGNSEDFPSKNGEMEVKETSKKFHDEHENHTSMKTREEIAPARRLSVAAAISLFESKKKDSTEPPIRKLVKQESRNVSIEGSHSPSEKSVLKRWNTANSLTTVENSSQDNITLHSEVERNLESDDKMKIIEDQQLQTASAIQSKEIFKKSLSDLFIHFDSNERPEKRGSSQAMNVVIASPHVKEATTRSLPDEVVFSESGIDSTNTNSMGTATLQSMKKSDLDPSDILRKTRKTIRNVVDEALSSSSKMPSVNMNLPTTTFKSIKKSDSDQSDSNPKVEQGNTQQSLEVQNSVGDTSQQIISRESILRRPAISGQSPVELEPVEPVIRKPQKESNKRPDGTNFGNMHTSNDLSTNDNNLLRKSSNFAKFSNPKTDISSSSMDIMLTVPIDLHMQALVKIVENPYSTILSLNVDDIPNEVRGKFFDQYSRLRDAKLRQEDPARRAEREAKLKSMKETLEKRKEEMESRHLQHSKGRHRATHPSGRQQEQQKAPPQVEQQKDKKDDDESTDQEEYYMKLPDDCSDQSSPVSTPHPVKNRSKPRTSTKMAQTTQRSSNVPRNTSAKSSLAKASQSKMSSMGNDGSVPKSTISHSPSESRKDVTKGSSTRAVIPPRKQSASSRTTGEANDDGSNVGNGDASFVGIGEREEVKQALGATDTKQNHLGSTHEARPFLRKGRGIGPGAGPNIMKQKASSALDTPKISAEDLTMECKLADPEVMKGMTGEEETSAEVHDPSSVILEEEKVERSSMLLAFPSSDDGFICLVDKEGDGAGEEEILETGKAGSLGTEEGGILETMDECGPGNTSENSDSPIEMLEENSRRGERYRGGPFVDNGLGHKQREGMLLSELLAMRNSDMFAPQDTSLSTSSMPHGYISSPSNNNNNNNSNPLWASPAYSSVMPRGAVSGRFSPIAAMDSPINTPDNELTHLGRHINVGGGPTTRSPSVPSLPPKESSSSKGFKRLLHFGRKSRAPETAAADCVSVSTTSEGDDDADDARESGGQLSDEFLRKLRTEKKGFELGESYSFPDQETAQFFGSSIPPPPANFKLREEQLAGGNSTKGPRSFFSLSSFRSKGNEGKSR